MRVGNPRNRRGVNFRPVYAFVFAVSLLAVYSLFIRPGPAAAAPQDDGRVLRARSSPEDCRLVHQAEDQCAFVKQACQEEKAGLIDYLHLYYCDLGNAKALGFAVIVCWASLLFLTIGVAASDFFSINLNTIAFIMGLSESLAGVTFLAFGNGSPDVFSTFAAMSSNSGSMAVGELIGAAGFITSVVAGSMALVTEFKVNRKTFVRDVLFFIAAVAFAMTYLSDGDIHLWECCTMVAFYIFYVVVVVGWHAWSKRRKSRRAREAASRGHYFSSDGNRANEELEPYRDNPDDDDDAGNGRQAASTPDISLLERAPRIEVDGEEEVDEEDKNQHAAAEMTSSMRVGRPRGRRSHTSTMTPIRPSLVGALEFRSVLSSLQQEGNMRLRPLHLRSLSADATTAEQQTAATTNSTPIIHQQRAQGVDVAGLMGAQRDRASSIGATPRVLDHDLAARTVGVQSQTRSRGHSPSTTTVDGKLAPPKDNRVTGGSADGSPAVVSQATPSPSLHRLRIPTSQGNSEASSPASPFPQYFDSPGMMTPLADAPGQQLMLPAPALGSRASVSTLRDDPSPLSKPISWWPYHILPAPHVLLFKLFPTFEGWKTKSIWDKFLSLVSIPSIFLLVITLPVVDIERTEDDADMNSPEEAAAGALGNATATVSREPDGAIEPETEWQRYRRSTRSREGSMSRSQISISLDGPNEASGPGTIQVVPPTPGMAPQAPKPAPDSLDYTGSDAASEDTTWNRWLLIVQLFLGPLFCVLVVWANLAESLDNPVRVLVRAILISLVCSLVLLAILLLTTSPDRRPKFHYLFCFLGFIIAIAWISTVAGEVVGVMKALGVIFDISEALLGLTIFAVGNSVGDLVADITIARLGLPVMALSACFGGPLLNILLGIGLGGAYQTIQHANKHHAKHPEEPFHYKPYHIHVTGTLMISAITLLVTLAILLIVVPLNKWIMSRKIGFLLIALWVVSTVVNVIIELTGTWQELA